MTENIFKEAKNILNKIEYIRKLRTWAYNNPLISEDKKSSDYMYLSWADNEEYGLKNTIIEWCDKEIKRLQARFDEL